MTIKFKFKEDDEHVAAKLSAEEIAAVYRWQEDEGYQFSFHMMHEAGWPCYLLEEGRDGQQLPKVNLKDYTGEFLGDGLVEDWAAANDFKGVVAANLQLFQRLAEKYYEGEEAEEARPGKVVQYDCTTAGKANKPKPIQMRLPEAAKAIPDAYWANFKARAESPNCRLHRGPDCLESSLVEIPATEYAMVRSYYDENGEIQED